MEKEIKESDKVKFIAGEMKVIKVENGIATCQWINKKGEQDSFLFPVAYLRVLNQDDIMGAVLDYLG